jgi:lipoprotein LprG
MRSRLVGVSLAVLLATLAACTNKSDKPPAGDLPAGDQLLTASATAMRDVKTVHFVIETEGTTGLPLHKADVSVNREGNAKGTAQIEQSSMLVELQLIVIGSKLYLKGPTGSYQELPLALASTVYDPSAILDPERGVAKLLATAKEGKTEAKEQVNGADAYRVAVKLDGTAVAGLLPGASAITSGQLWIDAGNKKLVKAKFAIPAQGATAGGTVTVMLSDFDAPVTVSAP